nr:hypothetical protein [Eubacterium sp.]
VYYLAIVAPIKEIDRYAEEIAKGKLDLQLPMRRTNLFERFTESFDMMRESLKQAKKEEMAANAAKAELVSELSHDIKTPIATIEATCEVMQMQYQNKLAKLEEENGDKEEIDEVKAGLEKLGFIANKSETIIKLVENVLHVNMDEVDELKVEPRELDTIEIEKLIKNTTGYGNIILKNHIRRCLVYADKLRLEQAIDNVINNSYKYAGTDIMVEFAESSEVIDGRDRGFIKIIISDRGPGVSDREMPLLTEKYYRGKNKGEKDGYGLGLYLVKLYMEKQGGGMEYYNSDGFVVELILQKV